MAWVKVNERERFFFQGFVFRVRVGNRRQKWELGLEDGEEREVGGDGVFRHPPRGSSSRLADPSIDQRQASNGEPIPTHNRKKYFSWNKIWAIMRLKRIWNPQPKKNSFFPFFGQRFLFSLICLMSVGEAKKREINLPLVYSKRFLSSTIYKWLFPRL